MVSVKHQLFKNSEKGAKTGKAYRYRDQSGMLFTPKWNIDFLLGGIHNGKKTQKNKLFRCVFLVKKTMKAKIVNNEKH